MTCERCGHVNAADTLQCAACDNTLLKSKLRVVYENGESETHYLFGKTYRLGRGRKNDINLHDASVSRHHADLTYKAGSFVINDKKSKNGSMLNDLPFDSSVLKHEDSIQLGNVLLHFLEEPVSRPNRNLDTVGFVQEEYFKLARNTGQRITTRDILKTVLELAASLVHADDALILQFTASGTLVPKVARHAKEDENGVVERIRLCKPLLERAIQTNKMQVALQAAGAGQQSRDWQRIAVPLVALGSAEESAQSHTNILGVCLLSREEPGRALSKRKTELLSALMQQLALALENDLLHDISEQSERINQELSLAKEIQQQLLPLKTPKIAQFSIATFTQPCEAISGDYLDIIQVSDTTIGLAIGDVCGKGIPAALLASTVQAAIRSQLDHTASIVEIVHNLNKLLLHNTANSIFLTLFFGILDLENSELRYLNAGHPPPFYISSTGEITELAGNTPPLGILETSFETEGCVKFGHAETIIMYTDGLIESHNPQKQIYGRKRFASLVHALVGNSVPESEEIQSVVDQIKTELITFIDGARQTDDLTILALKRVLPPS